MAPFLRQEFATVDFPAEHLRVLLKDRKTGRRIRIPKDTSQQALGFEPGFMPANCCVAVQRGRLPSTHPIIKMRMTKGRAGQYVADSGSTVELWPEHPPFVPINLRVDPETTIQDAVEVIRERIVTLVAPREVEALRKKRILIRGRERALWPPTTCVAELLPAATYRKPRLYYGVAR